MPSAIAPNANLNAPSRDWETFLSKREGRRLPGLLAASTGVMKGAVRDRCCKAAEVSTDSARMTMTAMISTNDEDRSEDIVEPAGCQLERYALNPICYFDHGQDYTLPIGRSEDDDGHLT